MEHVILDLLADRVPVQARSFLAHWGERRNASWADAAKQAADRAASAKHLPQLRGQLRYHLGEAALGAAAQLAAVGSFPLVSKPPGGVFNVARVGRFALVSVTIRDRKRTPRRSLTRRMLAAPNENLDPQVRLVLPGETGARGATELAYFGCMVAIPAPNDPTVPAELAIAVPNATLNDWIAFIPLPRAFGLLQERGDQGGTPPRSTDGAIPDRVLPMFRVPKTGEEPSSD